MVVGHRVAADDVERSYVAYWCLWEGALGLSVGLACADSARRGCLGRRSHIDRMEDDRAAAAEKGVGLGS